MLSQTMSATNYSSDHIRTPYHTTMAHRTSELYSKPAKFDGKVTKVDDRGITIVYENGQSETYTLGLYLGDAAGEIHRHNRVTDLKVGDEFKAGDILGWNEVYFERDMYNPRQVVWKSGFRVNLALMETQFTFEDSLAVSSELAGETKSSYILSESFTTNYANGVIMHVNIGDEVTTETILCDIEDESLTGLDDEGSADYQLERIGVKQKRSPHHGKVVKVDILYNGDVSEMSPATKRLVKKYDRLRKLNSDVTNDGITHGNVAGIKGMKESLEPGKIRVTIYIEEFIETQTADKFVVGNQMKGTVGDIFPQSYVTTDGRKVDMIFSFKSMYNRMVLSLRDKIVTSSYLIKLTDTAIDLYRGR